MKSKIWACLLPVAAAAVLCAGCVSLKPDTFENQVHQWVPLGTSEAKAEHIMKHHGFDCDLVKQDSRFNQLGFDYLDCSRTQVWFHDWNARILFTDGKVSGYAAIRVE